VTPIPVSAEAMPRPIRVVNRDSIVADLVQQLLAFLASTGAKPGEKLPSERQLSTTFGIGRSAIREALKFLHVLGIVDVQQGRGTFVRQTTSDAVLQVIDWGLILAQPRALELIETRAVIEVAVTRLAAIRANESDRRSLVALVDEIGEATQRSDLERFLRADVAFHAKIARISGNEILADILKSVRGLQEVAIRQTLAADGITAESHLAHLRIVEAIVDRDPDRAASAMEEHMSSGAERLRTLIEDRDGT
jgi:GntR family transcriptional repressor for pyruvate dehydrogenase complex